MAITPESLTPSLLPYGRWRSGCPPSEGCFDLTTAVDKEQNPDFVLLLNEALRIAKLEKTPNSTIAQLERGPVELANPGLIMYSTKDGKHPEQEGYAMPHAILGVLEGLQTRENMLSFCEWGSRNLWGGSIEDTQATLDVLNSIVSFSSSLLDSRGMQQLFEVLPGVVDISSIKNLDSAILNFVSSREDQPRSTTDKLCEILHSLRESFPRLLGHPSIFCYADQLPFLLEANVDMVTRTSMTEIRNLEQNNALSLREKAQRVMNYLIHTGVQDIGSIVATIEKAYLNQPELALLARSIWKTGVNIKKIEDPYDMIKNLIKIETMCALCSNQRVDICNSNLASEIPPGEEIEILQVLLPTGMYGPLTLGHESFIQRIWAYSQTQKNESTHTMILATPLVQIDKLRHHKDPESVATETERLTTMMAYFAHDRDIKLTTLLQPDPEVAVDTAGMIALMKAQLQVQLIENFLADGRPKVPALKLTYCAGSDELLWRPSPNDRNKRILSPVQQTKFNNSSLVICRAGDMIDCILNGREIAEQMDADVVITPGSNMSSRQAIAKLACGDVSSFSVAAECCSVFWTPESIQDRRDRPWPSGIPSVDTIYDQALIFYRQRLIDQGLIDGSNSFEVES